MSSISDLDLFLEKFANNDYSPIKYNGSLLELKLNSEIGSSELLNKIFDTVNVLPENVIEIKLSSCKIENTFFFYELKDFLTKYSRHEENFEELNLIVLLPDGKYIRKNSDGNDEKNILVNIWEYKQVLNYFLSTPEFTPYKNSENNEFTLITKKSGVFNIGYKLPDDSYFQNSDLRGLYKRIKENFSKKEYIQFFKEIIIESVFNTPKNERFNLIIEDHNVLLNLATRDYETYVSEFAFDKIKSQFKEEREKYFETIDKNIESIGKQVISFPLTFAATIFASYKVKEEPGFLILILAAYILYTIIAYLVLNMTAYNVKCLLQDVSSEEETIKESYQIIYSDFEKDFQKIHRKILNLRIIVTVLFVVLTLLLILFLIYTLHNLEVLNVMNILDCITSNVTNFFARLMGD